MKALTLSPDEALTRLRDGNQKWLAHQPFEHLNVEDVQDLVEGQSPYAVVITCSDSRVIPEAIFDANTGDLFVIRTAGNTIGDEAMGSIEYAIEHLGTPLVLILGHTQCGAINAAIHGETGTHIDAIVKRITVNIDHETDAYKACCLNVKQEVAKVRKDVKSINDQAKVVGGVFSIETGKVTFL